MSSDLISRQAVLDTLKGFNVIDIISYEHGVIYVQAVINAIYNRLNNLPSVEPERKKGKWIDGMLYHDFDESEWEKVKCSVCKNFVTKQIFYHDNKYHYCPYCGADMRGDHEYV